MRQATNFSKGLTAFLTRYLPGERGARPHTIASYRDMERAVMESLREHEAELLKTPIEVNESDIPTEHLLHTKERELESLRDGVNRLKDLFVMGDATKAEYKTRLQRLKDLIMRKENEYEQLKENLDGYSRRTTAVG